MSSSGHEWCPMLCGHSGFCLPVPEMRWPSRVFKQPRVNCVVLFPLEGFQGEAALPEGQSVRILPVCAFLTISCDRAAGLTGTTAVNCCFLVQHGLLITCMCGPPSSCYCSVPCIISTCLSPSAPCSLPLVLSISSPPESLVTQFL